MKTERLVGIDLIRIAAAFVVAWFHLAFWSWAPKVSTPGSILAGATSYPELVAFSRWGWVGVDIFFLLSGFVIAYTALRSTAVHFLRSRFLRLFPGALVCATITLVVSLAIDRQTSFSLYDAWLNSVTLWPYGPYIDGQYWTLPIEIAFYAFVLGILATGQRTRLEGIITATGSAIGAWWLVTWFDAGHTLPAIDRQLSRQHTLLFLQHGAHFALGVSLYFAVGVGWTWRRAMVTAICLGGAIAAMCDRHGVNAVSCTMLPASALAIYLSARHDAAVRKVVGGAAPWIATASLATYPFYLVHDVVGAATLRWAVLLGTEKFTALAVALGAMAALSLLVTIYPEKQIRALLGSLLSPSKDLSGAPDGSASSMAINR